MKREVVIVEKNPAGRGSNMYRGVIDSQFVVMAKGGQGARADMVGLTLSTGEKVLVQDNVSDWLDPMPELYYIDILGQVAVDGLGQPMYFHSEERAQICADKDFGSSAPVVREVPEAARRWMMAGIRVW